MFSLLHQQNQSLQINELVRELNNSTVTLTFENAHASDSLSRSNSSESPMLSDVSRSRCLRSPSASTSLVKNDQIEADVEQLMDLMKTRKQQLESLLNEKMKDFGLLCVLENVR